MPLSEVIHALFERQQLALKYQEEKILAGWAEIVGEVVARRTDKIAIREGVLIIHTQSAPLKHQFLISKSRVIALCNSYIGGTPIIKDIFVH